MFIKPHNIPKTLLLNFHRAITVTALIALLVFILEFAPFFAPEEYLFLILLFLTFAISYLSKIAVRRCWNKKWIIAVNIIFIVDITLLIAYYDLTRPSY